MRKNIIEATLLVIALVLVCLCFLTTKKYTFRTLISAIIVLTLLVTFQNLRKEAFTNPIVDVDNLIESDGQLHNEQKQTSRELDILEAQIQVMKKIYLNNISERRNANSPKLELKCTPPTAYFDDENAPVATPEYEGLNIDNLNITAEQLQNLINNGNNLTN